MSTLEIIRIDELSFAGKKLHYEYETDRYFDALVVPQGGGEWSANFVLKKFESPVTKRFDSELFKSYIENPIAYKCMQNGVIAGFMQLGFESWNKRLRVWEILVESGYRKQGVGSKFFEQVKSDARTLGARMIILETQSCNFPAISFYQKLGFSLIGFDLAAYSNEDQEKKEVRLEFGYRL